MSDYNYHYILKHSVFSAPSLDGTSVHQCESYQPVETLEGEREQREIPVCDPDFALEQPVIRSLFNQRIRNDRQFSWRNDFIALCRVSCAWVKLTTIHKPSASSSTPKPSSIPPPQRPLNKEWLEASDRALEKLRKESPFPPPVRTKRSKPPPERFIEPEPVVKPHARAGTATSPHIPAPIRVPQRNLNSPHTLEDWEEQDRRALQYEEPDVIWKKYRTALQNLGIQLVTLLFMKGDRSKRLRVFQLSPAAMNQQLKALTDYGLGGPGSLRQAGRLLLLSSNQVTQLSLDHFIEFKNPDCVLKSGIRLEVSQ